MSTDVYKPKYGQSWALVIGINQYEKTAPLEYATNDAEAVAELLINNYGFPKSNVSLLLDQEAKREKIFRSFFNYANECEPDDRILVFFAGHGHTVTGKRGEIGFLVPVDGSPDDLSSLIRWKDLTENAELIHAKHIFFVVDACFGGLALTRSIPPGSMRFLKDMVQRYSRQVLTSGKANELVADGGGPIAGHSIFTGHFLSALGGKAATKEGILTANSVMSYVYDRVANDYHSRQTPHYGFVDGDGDFVFNLLPFEEETEEAKKDEDVLIEIPPKINVPSTSEALPSIEDIIKECLSDNRYKIRLDDLANSEIRKAIYKIGNDAFPVQTADVSVEELVERLKKYEQLTIDLQKILILSAKWGTNEHKSIMEKILARFGEANAMVSGKVVWIGLRWYPIHLLLYSGGIAALAADNYENLAIILKTKIMKEYGASGEVMVESVGGILDVSRTEIFKKIPGHENNYVPLSEYLLKALQPSFEDLLFLGRQYEVLFDKFEVFYALVYADLKYDSSAGHVWGPPGRFAYKYNSRDSNPFSEIITEASRMKEKWPPLLNGFFQGSYERFRLIADGYEKALKALNWW